MRWSWPATGRSSAASSGSPIAAFQLIQGMLADSAVDIAVNRAYTHQVAWEVDDRPTDRKTLHAKAAIAKLSASEASGRVIDRCLQIFGGRGYDRSYPVERLYRELRVRPHLGGHLRDPAADHRGRAAQAWARGSWTCRWRWRGERGPGFERTALSVRGVT